MALLSFALPTFVAPESQLSMLAYHVPLQGVRRIEGLLAAVVAADVSFFAKVNSAEVALECLMLPESLFAAFVSLAPEAVCTLVDSGMST